MIHTYRPSSQEDSRTLLLLHGTGGNEDSLLWMAEALAPTAAVLSVRGAISEHGAPRFFKRFSEGVFDLDDLRIRADELASFLHSAHHEYGFDLKDLVAVGYSNGANMAWSTMLLHPDVLSSAILFRPMVTLTEDAANLQRKRIFVCAGEHDPIVPKANTLELVSQMKGLAAAVELNWHAGGHELGRDEIQRARDWLAAWVA